MQGLGCLLQQLGQLTETEQLWTQCLGMREAQLGPQHAENATALLGVGSVPLEQQQRAEAKLLVEKAVYSSSLPRYVHSLSTAPCHQAAPALRLCALHATGTSVQKG